MSATFDIIFAGGGTTACVIAGRLATANPSLKMLIVKNGQLTQDPPSHVQPCRFVEHLALDTATVSFHVAKPSLHLNGRAAIVPCGRCVGGGSAVIFMLYVRGAASDYDDWHALGNRGWSFNDALPFVKKFETFTPISDKPTHGYSGPDQISAGRADFGIGGQLLNVAEVYDPARPRVDDNNDFKVADAITPAYKYLYPHAENPNVTIMVRKRVKRVIVENGRAVGIEYTALADAQSREGVLSEIVTAKASKLVVVPAGAFGSPAILERSGIGGQSVLERNNIPVLVDLPGVGENYQDRLGICPAFYATDETETLDDVWSDSEAITEQLQEWEGSGTGKIAHNGIEAVIKVRPTTTQLASAGSALQSRWESFFQDSPDKPLANIVPFSGQVATAFPMYPELTGRIHITSGEDANSPLDFGPGYPTKYALPCPAAQYCSHNILFKPADVAQFTLLYKMTREHARRMPAYQGEVTAYHPKFPPDSRAACVETGGPVRVDVPDIVYSAADDEAIAKFSRDMVLTTCHSLGTCAMKPRDQGGVVDAHLNMYGVNGLKVIDMSICPTNVGNNTYSTALLIGERAAAIIAEEL